MQNSINEIIYSVKSAYYNLVFAQKQIDIYKKTIEEFELQLKAAQKYFAIGKKPQIAKIYGPIQLANEHVFLKVLNFTPGTKADFKEHLPEIKKLFSIQQRKQADQAYIARLRAKAVIRYYIKPL